MNAEHQVRGIKPSQWEEGGERKLMESFLLPRRDVDVEEVLSESRRDEKHPRQCEHV